MKACCEEHWSNYNIIKMEGRQEKKYEILKVLEHIFFPTSFNSSLLFILITK